MWVMRYILHIKMIGGIQSDPLFNAGVTLGNTLAFLLFIYPTQVLRPGWLNWWRAVVLLLPMLVLGVVDYFVPVNLLPVIMIYPAIIFFTICRHIRKYRQWCEDNFSTLDNIDVQWIIRYCIMLFFIGANYVYMCTTHGHARGLTQQWFVVFMLVYSTEQILYRKDPWEGLRGEKLKDESPAEEVVVTNADDCKKLEAWMDAEKPYLNPDFKLIDIRAVLPTNRTYISQLINSNYGCSFYHFVNRYRIDEAKHLMQEQPGMKMADIATRCGFSSRTVFTHTFTREVGISPTEWSKQKNGGASEFGCSPVR